MTAPDRIARTLIKTLAKRGRSLIAPFLSMALFLLPRVTVLSAVGIIRRNIWSEAQVLQCPQRRRRSRPTLAATRTLAQRATITSALSLG
jgi:hypothetical protein